jgi:hypothetical protein
MMMYECTYCNNSFSNKYKLNRHVGSSQRCIKLRKGKIDNKFICKCGYSTSRSDILVEHQLTCIRLKTSSTIDEFKKNEEIYLAKINDQAEVIVELKEQVKLLISRPINVTQNNTTHNNYNNKFYTQYVLDNFEALTPNLLQGVMEKMSLVDISHGGTGLAKFAKKHLDHQHLLMLDQARRKGLYKDANGEAKQDSELRDFLTIIGQTAFPPANILFTEWTVSNKEDCFLNDEKSGHLTRLLDVVGWLKRVGTGIIHNQDSDTQAQFLGEFVAGFSKEALHNCIERPPEPPLIEEEEVEDKPEDKPEDAPEVDSDSSEWPEEVDSDSSEWPEEEAVDSDVDEIETVIEMDIASMASSEFDIDLGILSYETDRQKGISDDRNYWIEYKSLSKFG